MLRFGIILLLCRASCAWLPTSSSSRVVRRGTYSFALPASVNSHDNNDDDQIVLKLTTSSRRSFVAAVTATSLTVFATPPVYAKCKDIETCREIGEQKDADKLAAQPIVRLGGGLQYKVLTSGLGNEVVTDQTKVVNIAYSISQANGNYMYSAGYGYNQIDAGGGKQMPDLGLDGLTVHLQDAANKEVPEGIRRAVMGMRRGEKRRIEVPPSLGFETSDWNPKPTTYRGERQIIAYKDRLYGRGDLQPAFPAPTIWDVELLSIR